MEYCFGALGAEFLEQSSLRLPGNVAPASLNDKRISESPPAPLKVSGHSNHVWRAKLEDGRSSRTQGIAGARSSVVLPCLLLSPELLSQAFYPPGAPCVFTYSA